MRGILTNVGTSAMDVLFRRLSVAVMLCCLLLHNEVVKSQSIISQKDIEITFVIGKDAVLTCTIRDLGSRKAVWSRLSDPFPIAVGSTRFVPNKKYKVESPSKNSVQLTIKNVGLEDAGEYQCRASGQVYLAETITLNVQAGPGTPYLLTTETRIVKAIGETAILPCHVENMRSEVVLWKNDKNQVLSMRKKEYAGDRRINVIHNNRTEWSLEIKKLRESDFGFYTCLVNSDPILTRTVELVNEAPAQHAPILERDTHFKKRLTVEEGETVTLTCNFNANPPAKVTWFRRRTVDGKVVKQKMGRGNTYTLESVSVEQSADYICRGSNGIKPIGRGKTKLIVQAPPQVEQLRPTTFVPTGPVAPAVYYEEQRVGQYRGRSVKLVCTAIGDPRPAIHWKFKGHRVENTYKYEIVEKITTKHNFESTLNINSLVTRDFGEYECWGHNQLGLKSIVFELYELK